MSKTNRKVRTLRIRIGEADKDRRANLLQNAIDRVGKVEQRGDDIILTVGSEAYEYVEYTIIDAKLPEHEQIKESTSS